MLPLADTFQRKFYYLRLSITDVCNFRCTYCLPDGYKPNKERSAFLSVDEISRVAQAFGELGTSKIRLTGGEPSMRRDFTEIITAIHDQPAIKQIAMTTNGYRLAKEAANWRMAGLTSVNVSLDSLDARQFQQITGQNKFQEVMAGIDACFDAGFPTVKINVVLMKHLTQQLPTFLAWIKYRSIQLRFIELMETGEGSHYFNQHHLSGEQIRGQLLAMGWQRRASEPEAGPAQIFSHPDYQGEIGLIMPYDKHFCESCNRLRVSAIGQLHLCLFGENGITLRDLLQSDTQQTALQERIRISLIEKKQTHFLHQGMTGLARNLSYIGG
ncbi:GTP 3',8-cyclase MoaA [Rosenbergiella australiborealis]|uniref:GTP 3',8-cyclase n=1 Tax=Rosenbergiella australiborealis TaxID=1544696 RepID=A0ABS5T4F4_9GAMM|nr:GTP 3',8-cyclase MoaA [Rosenbergiella australiborealis]MBT0727017.1 GTP 3',8-cyclase MoaA [Rosenbergiella australiborealis]